MQFPGLDPTAIDLDSPLHRAQRFLASAYDSVAGLFETTYPVLRDHREGSRGRLTHAEQDVFRAVVVFTGAGVDAVFKEALRSSVRIQIDRSDAAREKYLDFVVRYIRDGSAIDARALAALLVSDSPDLALKDAYVERLTGSSLQSVLQVTSTLTALGLSDETDLFKAAKSLAPLFKVRNQIAHELDMTTASIVGRGARHRNERPITTYKSCVTKDSPTRNGF